MALKSWSGLSVQPSDHSELPIQADPTIQLANANGQIVASDDNWKTTEQSAIQATGLSPPNDLEPAALITLPNAAHTAIVSDKYGATRVALVEVYKIR